jgi:hypothetical protein
MREITVKFKDSEFGNKLIKFSTTRETRYELDKDLEFAIRILYLDFEYNTLEELQKDNEDLTQEIYDICMDILDGGSNGVTTERFCDFMEKAFGWKQKPIEEDYVIDIEYGDLY